MTRSSFRNLLAISVLSAGGSFAYSQQPVAAVLPDAPGFLLASSPDAAAATPEDARDSSSAAAPGQQSQPSPQSQTPQQAASGPPPEQVQGQTKRILGIIPNFRAVNENAHLPPQSVKEKFIDATEDSFDYSSVVLPGVVAGFNQARNATPEFHQGAAGYGRYFWHTFVDQTQENYWVEFIVPAIAHEDTRFYTLGHGGFKKRAIYALGRVVITRDDAGKETFNSGEILGAAFSSALSNAYYPQAERTVGNTVDQYVLNIGIDAGTYLFKEFWPDINRRVLHGKGD